MQLALALIVVFLAQLVKGVTGFGAALVAVPPLTLLYGPAEAVVLASTCDLLSGVGLMWKVRSDVRWQLVLVMFLPLLIGLQAGATLLQVLPREGLMILMGGVVATMGARFAIRPVESSVGVLDDLPQVAGSFYYQAAGAGFLSGVMAGSVGTSGPPTVVWARRWLTDRFFRVQVIAILFLSGMALPLTLLSRGLIERETLAVLPYLLIPLFLGVNTGSWLAPRLSKETFGRVVGVVLVGSGLMLVGRAMASYSW